MGKVKLALAGSGGLLLLAALIFITLRLFQSPTIPAAHQLTRVERGDLTLAVVATGAIIPATTVEIKSKTSGIVERILVEEGTRVQAGQPLLELDRELLAAQVREARANLLAARARLQEAEAEALSARALKVKLETDLRNQADHVAFLKRQLSRYQAMYEEELIPYSELDQRERELHEASLRQEAIRSEIEMQEARIQAADKAVARVQAEVTQAQAGLDRAEENLRYATILSPISAAVLKRHVEVGDAVSSILQLGAQAPTLLTLGDLQKVFFEGRVDENDIGKVFIGQKALVRVDAFREEPFPGQVLRIAPQGEARDNVIGFRVRVSLEDPQGRLRPQMTANAEIIIEERRGVLRIPEKAIIYDRQGGTFVELVDPSTPQGHRRIPVEVGISNGTLTEIRQGLEEGQQILSEGARGLL